MSKPHTHIHKAHKQGYLKFSPTLKVLSQAILAVTLATTGTAYASEYSSITFFGDSLTDGGYLKPLTQAQGLEEAGQFTTNPDNTWATPFANQLGSDAVANRVDGSQKGNNYAIGGARAGVDVNREGFVIDSAKAQVDSYLANNQVDSNGMYALWVGANDIFAASEYIQSNISSFIVNKEETTQKSIDDYVLPAVADQIATINTLHSKGAEYILVPNIPDVGLTPQTIQADESIKGNEFLEEKLGADIFKKTGNRLASAYNDALYQGLKQSEANIIPLDSFGLLQQVAADPSLYGFSNMTDKACGDTSSLQCGRDDLVEENAQNSYFFADSIHPTGRAHQMIADYANAVVTAPSQVGVLPHIATRSGLVTNERLQTHINQLYSSHYDASFKGPSVWATADINQQEVAGFDSSGNTQLMLGLDFPYHGSGHAVSGIYANVNNTELDHPIRTGLTSVDVDEIGFGLYHSNQWNNLQLNGALGYGHLDMDVTRRVTLDNYQQDFKSDADGKRYYASVRAGYPIQMDNRASFSTTITPYLGATFNRVKVDALKEKEMTGIAMQFDKQEYDTTYGTLGIKANSNLGHDFDVFGDIHYQKQLNDDRDHVTARLNTLPNIGFNTPDIETDDDSFGISLGVARQFGVLRANAGVSHESGDDDEVTSVFVGLSGSF